MIPTIELRVTFADIGDDPASRNGHYYRAKTITEALTQAIKDHPDRPLTVQKWHGFSAEETGSILFDDTQATADNVWGSLLSN